MRSVQYCQLYMYSSHGVLVKFDSLRAGPLKAAYQLIDNFLPMFMVGSPKFVKLSIQCADLFICQFHF
jgi:hypothetical protein